MIVYPWSESNRLVISSDVAQWGKQALPPKHKPDTYICQRELHAHPFPFLVLDWLHHSQAQSMPLSDSLLSLSTELIFLPYLYIYIHSAHSPSPSLPLTSVKCCTSPSTLLLTQWNIHSHTLFLLQLLSLSIFPYTCFWCCIRTVCFIIFWAPLVLISGLCMCS